MLTEQYIASVGSAAKASSANAVKEAAIFVQEFQPLNTQRVVCKKSSTPPQCLAVNDTHVFAAQNDKSVVHVYNREKGTQEATVPFTERISAITLACHNSVLVLGTEEGRLFLWEICSGRQITTQQEHLQAVTSLAVDATSNFLASASKDATVHLWSIPALLAFGNAQGKPMLQSFTEHNDQIVDVLLGHSAWHANFAVSISKDKTCLIWDYQTNSRLRTYLLPESPLCLGLDPADRAVYIGYEDGCVQQIDLFATPGGAARAVQDRRDALAPIQISKASRWNLSDQSHGAALSLTVSFDGSTVLSGHRSGSVLAWDVGKASFSAAITTLPGPVNCLSFLPITGFQYSSFPTQKALRIPEVVKPRFNAFDSSNEAIVPENYALNIQLLPCDDNFAADDGKAGSEFLSALTEPVFPASLLDASLNDLLTWNTDGGVVDHDQDNLDSNGFISLQEAGSTQESSQQAKLLAENQQLKAQIDALRRVQTKSFEKIEKLSEERAALIQRAQQHAAQADSDWSDG